MDCPEMARRIDARLGAGAATVWEDLEPQLLLPAGKLVEACVFLRDDPDTRLDYLRCLTGLDLPPDAMAVVIHLVSTVRRHRLALRVETPREKPAVPSVACVWPGAGWFEREAWDLLGIDFPGNGDLRRILLPDEWVGHPLRKDYAESRAFFNIPTQRPESLEVVARGTPGRPAAAEPPAAGCEPAPGGEGG